MLAAVAVRSRRGLAAGNRTSFDAPGSIRTQHGASTQPDDHRRLHRQPHKNVRASCAHRTAIPLTTFMRQAISRNIFPRGLGINSAGEIHGRLREIRRRSFRRRRRHILLLFRRSFLRLADGTIFDIGPRMRNWSTLKPSTIKGR